VAGPERMCQPEAVCPCVTGRYESMTSGCRRGRVTKIDPCARPCALIASCNVPEITGSSCLGSIGPGQ
jgi:hypothetical protein